MMRKRNKTKLKIISVTLLVGMLAGGCGTDTIAQQDAFCQYGMNCMADGKYAEAANAFQSALNLSRGRVSEREIDLCYYKAEAFFMDGQFEEAQKVYDAIVDYNGAAEGYYMRGCLKVKMGQVDAAATDFAQAIGKEKNSYEMYIGVYEAFASQNLIEQGNAYLNKALEIHGDRAYDKMEKGRIYLLLGDTSSAINYLKQAVEKESQEAAYYLALAYETAGDEANADIYYQSYIESGIADAMQLWELGKRQMKNKNYSLALSYFQAALSQDKVTNRAEILKDMAISYEYLGDFNTARTTLTEYLVLEPNDDAATREMVFLETR